MKSIYIISILGLLSNITINSTMAVLLSKKSNKEEGSYVFYQYLLAFVNMVLGAAIGYIFIVYYHLMK